MRRLAALLGAALAAAALASHTVAWNGTDDTGARQAGVMLVGFDRCVGVEVVGDPGVFANVDCP